MNLAENHAGKTIRSITTFIVLFSGETLNHKQPLFIPANKIDWEMFEREFSSLYCPDNGRSAKPIRLMMGLLILKHVRNLSDESMVEQWSENSYYQYFCGEQEFQSHVPCEASEPVHFLHLIGKESVELIFRESIRINGKDSSDKDVYIDTTVQEKDITFSTDNKLVRNIVRRCRKTVVRNGLKIRQSYRRILKDLSYGQRFRNHLQNKGKTRKVDKKVRTIAGRLVREVERKLSTRVDVYRDELELYKQILARKKKDRSKVYFLYEVDVQCISGEKEHKQNEFGNKVSITRTGTDLIVGALSFRNEFDGHTLNKAIEQVEKLTESLPKMVSVTGDTEKGVKPRYHHPHPKSFSKAVSTYRKNKERKYLRKRASIKPVIGHLKGDYCLSHNYYKGIVGDEINVMLAAAGFNFKRMMNKWRSSFWKR